jgi:hypothetical protein
MLPPKDQKRLAPVPSGFVQELHQASADHQAAKLILLGLEVQGAPWENPAFALIGPALLALPPNSVWERVVLFTGHRVDSPNRKTPRFPTAKEQVARDAIRSALEEQSKSSKGPVLGVAGGANGGDLLFLEVCDELGIATEMLLTLPEEQFIKESVESDDKSWTERFYRQVQKHVHPPVLARSTELPAWLEFKGGYDIWQRNNLWLLSAALSHMARFLTVIALWDGKTGDAPGGTEHMVGMAKERGAQIVHLDTTQIFGLESKGTAPSQLPH